ncbi:SMI1/KNR4 family protein [Kineosporia sp. NBRC 101677]|uniref:SMI1/KNR4 family protein n=1 Tax=Kineosporia sp. NBRC 101677 TaxID=3032197 RepID=UPI002557478D|nr:SMI1/KNR4 family protein [Kineosporia sp. NBRC 101677]
MNAQNVRGSVEETVPGMTVRWRVLFRPTGPGPWREGRLLRIGIGSAIPWPMQRIEWIDRAGYSCTVDFSSDGSIFSGVRTTPDGQTEELQGQILGPTPAPESIRALWPAWRRRPSSEGWIFTIETADRLWRSTSGWQILLDDGIAPPAWVGWQDVTGASGEWDIAEPTPRERPVTIASVQADAEHAAADEVAANLLEPGPSKWFADQPTGDLILLLDEAATVTSYELVSGDDAPDRDPSEWQLLALKRSSWSVEFQPEEWQVVDVRSGEDFAGRNTVRRFNVSRPGSESRVYRLRITRNTGSVHLQLSRLLLFGLAAPHPDTVVGFREPAGGHRLIMRGYATTEPARHLLLTGHNRGTARWELDRAGWESPDPADPTGPVTIDEWTAFLEELGEVYPPALEEQILDLETQLGVRLPPSYRNFLRVSNGLGQENPIGPYLLPVEDVGWFRDVHREVHIDGIIIGADLGDWERVFGRSLAVSRQDDGWYLFLDPFTIDENGEWRAFRWRDGDASPPEAVTDFGALLALERSRPI